MFSRHPPPCSPPAVAAVAGACEQGRSWELAVATWRESGSWRGAEADSLRALNVGISACGRISQGCK
eukprot:9213548-Alexandrium_andersonii.AAC.1